ncbi:MAG TPA: hypothetical protein VGO59_21270 [Verrucomicrobiae bacterium]|jgi:alpha-tubulin suppressor-like RCC1 family protein
MRRLTWKLFGGLLLFNFCGLGCFSLSAQVLVWGDNSYGQTNVPASVSNVLQVAGGDGHCMALRSDGTVVAWGDNFDGQTNVPIGLSHVVSIAAGSTHSLALRSDGTLALWGRIYGQIYGSTGASKVPAQLANVAALAEGPGAQHALVLLADGSVFDWGDSNVFGAQLTNVPATATNIVQVASASSDALALRADGTVVTWGDDPMGGLTPPPGATNIVAIAAGWFLHEALRSDGTVIVWGGGSAFNYNGKPYGFTNIVDLASPFSGTSGGDVFGFRRNGTMTDYTTALPKYPSNGISAIGAGGYNAMAVAGTGAPMFTGLPINRRVASGLNAYFCKYAVGAMPISYQWTCDGTNVPGGTNSILTVTNVQPGQSGGAYAVIASNAYGVATNGPMMLYTTPLEVYVQSNAINAVVDQTVDFTANTVGQGPFAYQWQFNGANIAGATGSTLTLSGAQLTNAGSYSIIVGNNFGVETNSVALTVAPAIVIAPPQNQTTFPGGTAAFNISLQADIPVTYQWQFDGSNISGATTGSLTLSNAQAAMDGTYNVTYADAYETVTNNAVFAVVPVAAWGDVGQPPASLNLTNVVAVACGSSYDLALESNGLVVGWGMDLYGATVPPPGLSNVIAIATGYGNSLALTGAGLATAWGSISTTPSGLSNVVAVAAGLVHNLALLSDGSVVGWGDNSEGETSIPAGLSNVVGIAAGQYYSMALQANGAVVAWGDNTFGQSSVPAGLSHVVQIASGGVFSMALQADGQIVEWGDTPGNPPEGLSGIIAIAAGGEPVVGLNSGGTVAAWGSDFSNSTNVPPGLSNVVAVSACGKHVLALVGSAPPLTQAPLSNFQVTSAGFSLSLPSQSGHVYALEYTSDLSSNSWTMLPLAAGNGGTLTLADPAPSQSARYYRVRKW